MLTIASSPRATLSTGKCQRLALDGRTRVVASHWPKRIVQRMVGCVPREVRNMGTSLPFFACWARKSRSRRLTFTSCRDRLGPCGLSKGDHGVAIYYNAGTQGDGDTSRAGAIWENIAPCGKIAILSEFVALSGKSVLLTRKVSNCQATGRTVSLSRCSTTRPGTW